MSTPETNAKPETPPKTPRRKAASPRAARPRKAAASTAVVPSAPAAPAASAARTPARASTAWRGPATPFAPPPERNPLDRRVHAAIARATSSVSPIALLLATHTLRRLNRELGMDFDLDAFRHYASYCPLQGVARSFLVSQRRQSRSIIYSADYAAMNGLMGYLTENCCGGMSCSEDAACLPSPQRKTQANRGKTPDDRFKSVPAFLDQE